MRVIFEEGDKPEWRRLMNELQRCGINFMIVDEITIVGHKILSDDEIKCAIKAVMPFFTVSSQWVAIFRILVDYHGFPADITAFHKRVSQLLHGTHLDYPLDYQSVQKPLAASSILQKKFDDWRQYHPQKGDRVFLRQKMIADRFLLALEAPKSEA